MSYFLIPNRPPQNKKSIDEIIAGMKRTGAVGTPENPPGPSPDLPIDLSGCNLMRKVGNNYFFPNIQYQGKVIPVVELSGSLLDAGHSKTQANWAEWSKNNPENWAAVDAEILYQCLLKAYELRNDEKHKTIVQEFTLFMQGLLDPARPYLNTLTNIKYGAGLDAIVSRLGALPGNTKGTKVDIPEFTKYDDNWSYLTLAQEQPENQLGKMNPLPPNAKPALNLLLGKDYEKAGAVFQYFSPRKNGNLREARLWTPTSTNRNIERVVVLGVCNYDGFYINTYVINFSWPALGVRCAKNFPCVRN